MAGLRAACADAIDELKAARKLIASQDNYADKQLELFRLEQQINEGLKHLRELDAAEIQKLKDAIAASERETTALRAEVAVLKKQRATFWTKAKWFVIGGAAGIIAGTVLTR